MKDGRWYTNFGRFIGQFGVKNFVQKAKEKGHFVTEQAVYIWIKGDSQPRTDHARLIIELSEGKLSMDDIYNHPQQMKVC